MYQKTTQKIGQSLFQRLVQPGTLLNLPPVISDINTSAITDVSFTIGATINPKFKSTIVTIEYGLTTDYGDVQEVVTGSPVASLGQVSAVLTGLIAYSVYHFRIKAENVNGITYSDDMIQVPATEVLIVDQTWSKNNLTVTKTVLGYDLQKKTSIAEWAASTDPAYALPQYSDANIGYGHLLNYLAIQKIKQDITAYNVANPNNPYPFRTSESTDYDLLVDRYGGVSLAGGQMKENGTTRWLTASTGVDGGLSVVGNAVVFADGTQAALKSRGWLGQGTNNNHYVLEHNTLLIKRCIDFVPFNNNIGVGLRMIKVLTHQYRGKKIGTYGDSLVAGNLWQQAVINELLFGTHYLRGVGSSRVQNSDWLPNDTDKMTFFVNADGTYNNRKIKFGGTVDTAPVGTTEIFANMCTQDRIDTIPLDTEVLMILAGANDNGANVGDITDEPSENTTFIAAYKLMLQRIYARIPSLEIVIIGQPFSSNNDIEGSTYPNLRASCEAIANSTGILYVDTFDLWNASNAANYLVDGLHFNNIAGVKIGHKVSISASS